MSTNTTTSSSTTASSSSFQDSKFEYAFDDPKKMDKLMGSKGIFSFGLFRNYQDTDFGRLAYLFKEGISKYIEVTKREQFKDYVVLVYVDNSLFDFSDYEDPVLLKKEAIKTIKYIFNPDDRAIQFGDLEKESGTERQKILREKELAKWTKEAKKETEKIVNEVKELVQYLQKEDNCILCKYTIPEFLMPGTPFHYNFIGSMARFHALIDFADRRVCVRDADTYFPENWHYVEYKNDPDHSTREPFMSIGKQFVKYLEAWEENLLKYHSAKGLPFLIAYDHPYKFFNFRQKPIIETSRLLAGIVDALPHDKALFTEDDWNKAMMFLKDDAIIYNIRGSKNLEYNKNGRSTLKEIPRNNFKKKKNAIGTTYYGCDEKVLRYIFFEKWRGQTVLFYFPYAYMGSNLMYSDPKDKDSILAKYEKILDESVENKQDPLYLGIKLYINEYNTMNSWTRYQTKNPPGKHYFLFISEYPFFADRFADEIYGKIPDNIKGGTRKRKGNAKKSHKRRKSRKH